VVSLPNHPTASISICVDLSKYVETTAGQAGFQNGGKFTMTIILPRDVRESRAMPANAGMAALVAIQYRASTPKTVRIRPISVPDIPAFLATSGHRCTT
jgi:hypothetical protein